MRRVVLVGMLLVCLVLGAIPINSAEETQVTNVKKWSENGHYYELIKKDVNWNEAKEYAEKREFEKNGVVYKGYLATLTSQEENSWVVENLVSPTGKGDVYPWLGGYQVQGYNNPSEGWKWVTGEDWSWTNWNEGEPNDLFGRSNERYLKMYPSGKWNDESIDGEPGWENYILIEYQPAEEQNAPQAIRVAPSSSTVSVAHGEKQTFRIKATDEDGDLYMVQWEVNGEWKETDSLATLSAPNIEGSADFSYTFEESSTVKAIVYDEQMNTDSIIWDVEVTSTSSSKEWWTSEEGIANFAQLLNEKYNGKAWRVHQKENHILILVTRGVKTENIKWKYIDGTIHSIDMDIPEYYSFLFDKEKKDFIRGDAEDKIFEIYLEDYLKDATGWGFPYPEYIPKESNLLLEKAYNPWVSIGGPIMMEWCNFGKAYAAFLVSGPEPAGKTLVDAHKSMLLKIGETTFVKAELEEEEWEEFGQDLIEVYNKFHGAHVIYKQLKFVNYAEELKKAGELSQAGRYLTYNKFAEAANTVGELVFPTQAVTATTAYFSYSGGAANAAKALATKAEDNWRMFKRNPTWDNYVNTFTNLSKAYNQLALGYEFQAKAIEENKGGLTGIAAELIHNLFSKVDVNEKIKSLRDCSRSKQDFDHLMEEHIWRPIYWAGSAAESLIYPDIQFPLKSEGGEIVSCLVTGGNYKVEESVNVTVKVRNYKESMYTYKVGFSVKAPDGQVFDAPAKKVTLNPGESKELKLSWKVLPTAPPGSYDATVALWEEDFSKNYDRWGWKSGQFIVDSVSAEIISYTFDSGRVPIL